MPQLLSNWAGPALRGKAVEIRQQLRDNDCYLIWITARGKGVRWGKTSLATDLACLISDRFQPSNVVFTPFGWSQKIEELDPGEVIVKSEPRGAHARGSMSTDNNAQIETDTEWGIKNLCGIKIHTHIGRVDQAQLELSDAWVEIDQKRHHAIWHDIKVKTVYDNTGRPRMKLRMVPKFGFFFPDAAKLHPQMWAVIDEMDRKFKTEKRDPAVNLSAEQIESAKQNYLANRRVQRYLRNGGRPASP